MASSSTRRMSWRVLAPIVAIAAVGLSACSNNEEPSDVVGTTPPVWTGQPAPGAEHDTDHAATATGTTSAAATAELTAALLTVSGETAGLATFGTSEGGLESFTEVENLEAGTYDIAVHETGVCEGDFVSAGDILTLETEAPVGELATVVVAQDGIGTADLVAADLTAADVDGAAVVVTNPDNGQRVACGVIG